MPRNHRYGEATLLSAARLKLFRFLQERGDALEEASGASAVEDAVVEAQGELRFGDGFEFARGLIPRGHDPAGAEPEDEGLLGQGNGGGPFEAEGAEVCHCGDRAALGRGASVGGLPNAVLLMLALYVVAHVLMAHTALGRYIYAIGGNVEAARLSGVRTGSVLVFVYGLSGALAGLGGVVMASQLKSGSPTYGLSYELYVIAAVVVGGTSLSGGEGRIFGTLIGALIIGVIQNGMNLTGVESYTQKVVLGLVILGAVLLDMWKRRGWSGLGRLFQRSRA